MSKYRVLSGLYFSAFGLKKYGKIRTRKNSVFGHFSHTAISTIVAPTYARMVMEFLEIHPDEKCKLAFELIGGFRKNSLRFLNDFYFALDIPVSIIT